MSVLYGDNNDNVGALLRRRRLPACREEIPRTRIVSSAARPSQGLLLRRCGIGSLLCPVCASCYGTDLFHYGRCFSLPIVRVVRCVRSRLQPGSTSATAGDDRSMKKEAIIINKLHEKRTLAVKLICRI